MLGVECQAKSLVELKLCTARKTHGHKFFETAFEEGNGVGSKVLDAVQPANRVDFPFAGTVLRMLGRRHMLRANPDLLHRHRQGNL